MPLCAVPANAGTHLSCVYCDRSTNRAGEATAPAAGVGPGFPHGSSPWAEGPRDSGSHAVQPHGITPQEPVRLRSSGPLGVAGRHGRFRRGCGGLPAMSRDGQGTKQRRQTASLICCSLCRRGHHWWQLAARCGERPPAALGESGGFRYHAGGAGPAGRFDTREDRRWSAATRSTSATPPISATTTTASTPTCAASTSRPSSTSGTPRPTSTGTGRSRVTAG